MGPRVEQILPCPLGPPSLRPWRLTSILWKREGLPRPRAHGLGGGGLRGGPGTVGGDMWPPGHFPCQGFICHVGEPPLSGELDEGGGRVCPAVGLRHGSSHVGEPPVQPPGGGGGDGGTRAISISHAPTNPAHPPLTLTPPPSGPEAPRGRDQGTHRHTDRLPLGSRPLRWNASGTSNVSNPQGRPGAPLPHGRPPNSALSR